MNKLNKIKRSVLREAIDEIWRNEILLNWQNYWDSLRRKLKNMKITLHLDEKER